MGKFASCAIAALCLIYADSPARAMDRVAPGETITLTSLDGGGVECRRGRKLIRRCIRGVFLGTRSRPEIGRVRARSSVLLTPQSNAGVPQYAAAFIYKDVSLAGPPNGFVPVQISVTFDYQNLFLAASAHFAASSLTLKVTDLVSGADVAKHTLFETSRAGDQGLTDISGGSERQFLVAETANFSTLLRRGRDYRLRFELENVSQALGPGLVEGDAKAEWKAVTLRVDEDEFEALQEIKELLMPDEDDD